MPLKQLLRFTSTFRVVISNINDVFSCNLFGKRNCYRLVTSSSVGYLLDTLLSQKSMVLLGYE